MSELVASLANLSLLQALRCHNLRLVGEDCINARSFETAACSDPQGCIDMHVLTDDMRDVLGGMPSSQRSGSISVAIIPRTSLKAKVAEELVKRPLEWDKYCTGTVVRYDAIVICTHVEHVFAVPWKDDKKFSFSNLLSRVFSLSIIYHFKTGRTRTAIVEHINFSRKDKRHVRLWRWYTKKFSILILSTH
jgi:hypothetical protein